MANIRMMTATALAALLAMGAAPAAMADTDATIELDAVAGGTLTGHRYMAYRIGSYENAEESGGKVSRVDVVTRTEPKRGCPTRCPKPVRTGRKAATRRVPSPI